MPVTAALALSASGCWLRVAPDDPRLRYTGRVDKSDPTGPRFSHTATAVAMKVDASAVRLHLREVPFPRPLGDAGPNQFELLIDGASRGVLTARRPEWRHTVELEPGEHVVELFKRTEAEIGRAQLVGLELPLGARLLPPPERPERRIEIIGDSLSVGFGNTGAGPECPFTANTEDGYRAYPLLAARALRAEVHLVAWSGRGVVRNYDLDSTDTIPQLYERTIPEDPATRWDFSRWTPHAVVIFAGSNDFGQPKLDIEAFEQGYAALVTEVRRRSPDAFILAAYPYVTDDWPKDERHGTRSREAVDRVLAKLAEGGLTRVKAFSFDRPAPEHGLGCLWHPSLKTHEAMAERLRAVLSDALGW